MPDDESHLPLQRTVCHRRVVVGFDIGAETTHVRVVTRATGALLLDRVSPSATWSATPLRYATGWIVDAVGEALDACEGVQRTDLAAVAVGATGCEVRALCDALSTTVSAQLRVPAVVVNDAELLIPAAGLDSGVGVIVGTSAIAVATGPGSPMVGGASWAYSAVGSASAIVREAALSVLARAARGDDEHDALRVALMESMDLRSVDELAQVLHWDARALVWGAHAPAVFAAADEGSVDAAALLGANAQAVAALVVQLAERGVSIGHVVVAGDLAPEVPRLFGGIRRSIQAQLPGVDVRRLDEPAVGGAIVLAERSMLSGAC